MSLAPPQPQRRAEPTEAAPTLFDLVARTWALGAPVESLAVQPDGAAVAFGLADGKVAVVHGRDPEPAAVRIRGAADTGRTSIVPRKGAFAPAETAIIGRTAPTALIAAPSGSGFLAVVPERGLVAITARAQTVPRDLPVDGPIGALASHPRRNVIAFAARNDVHVAAADDLAAGTRVALPAEVTALAFSLSSDALAVGSGEAIILVSDGRVERELVRHGLTQRIAFSPDGAFLAAGLREGSVAIARCGTGDFVVLNDHPAPARTLSWSRPAQALITSGAYRAVAWSMSPPPFAGDTSGARFAGRTSLMLVEAVAAHPRRPLVAAGRADGVVTIAKIGTRDEMVLWPDVGGAVTALAWFGEGDELAIGRADGMAAIASLPPVLFK